MGNKIIGDASVAEDSAFRFGKFSINGKKLEVPLQALDAKKYYESKIDFGNLSTDVAEIYLNYSREKLKLFKEYPERNADEERKIKLWKDSIKESAVKFLFIRFQGKEYPNDDEMKALINVSYSSSDATPIPAFPDIFKEDITRVKRDGTPITETKIRVSEDRLKEFFSFLEKYIGLLNDWNHKDILGVIPINIGAQNISKLIAFYYNNGVNHFYLDLNTATFNRLIDTPLMHAILSELKRSGLEYQKTFFYSINGSSGRFSNGNPVIGAKDILTGGAGLDCVGRIHLGAGGGGKKITDPRVIEKMKLNRIRLFNKDDYGYYRLETKSLPFKLPEDNIINKELLLNLDKGKKFGDIFNMQQLTIENQNLRLYIKEGFKPLSKIEKEKRNVSKLDLKSIQRFRREKLKSLI
jgi:hypothetical protein